MRIDKLNKMIKKCSECRLSETRTNALFGEGKLDAKLMLIAQAPGEQENREGRMFIGPSGKVLDELCGEPHPDWMLPDGSIDKKLHKLGVIR